MSDSGPSVRSAAPRATIDTNLFVSGLISRGAPKLLLDSWDRGDIVLVLSTSVVEEIGSVLRRPAIRDRYHVAEDDVRRIEEGIARFAEVVEKLDPLPEGIAVRDPKDEHVLRAAFTGGAGYLVAGDDDLLSVDLGKHGDQLRIVGVREFLETLGPGA